MTEENLLAPDQGQEPDYIAELTGPGKKFDRSKYADETEMWKAVAKGKYEADRYVAFKETEYDKLSTDYKTLREDSMAGASLKEILDQLKEQQLASSTNNQIANEVKTEPAFDPRKIEDLIEQKLTAAERARKEKQNFDFVRNTLKEQYGENHQAVLKQQIEELDLNDEYVNELARTNPKVLLKLLAVGERRSENFQAPPRSSQSSSSFSPKVEKRDWNYYEKMRKENPVLYNNPKTQVQMHKDAIALKDAFGIPQD